MIMNGPQEGRGTSSIKLDRRVVRPEAEFKYNSMIYMKSR